MKIYLDTSVVSMLDDSERGTATKEFFEFINEKNYELVISEIVDNEIRDTKSKKKDTIIEFLNTLNCIYLSHSEESHDHAWNYIADEILTKNHFDDLLHVAYATVHNCNVIVSWNRKHIAKLVKIQKLNACNLKHNYNIIAIYTPEEFLTLFQ
jgi:predicted nucleic acid-binding protein